MKHWNRLLREGGVGMALEDMVNGEHGGGAGFDSWAG